MNRTIEYIIAAVFAVIIMGLLINIVTTGLDQESKPPGTTANIRVDGNDLVVSWKSEVRTKGLIDYRNASGIFKKRPPEYNTVHSVKIAGQNGFVMVNLSACTANGKCTMVHLNKTV
ncbi:MAG: hypothetical protein ACQESG_06365 [Nanobdellota archaeon]